jgi:hypothetical protein
MVASVGEQLYNIVTTTEFATKIKADITISRRNRKSIESEPRIKEL